MAKQKKQKLTAEQKKARREEARIKMKQDIKHDACISIYMKHVLKDCEMS